MRTIYSCVLDNRPLFAHQASIWALSLTSLAGQPADSLVVHAIEGTDPRYVERVQRFGVEVVTVKPFDPTHPYSNKLAQLESPHLSTADHVVLCDCDIAFCADISSQIGGNAVRGKTVDRAELTQEDWQRIFAAAGVPMPKLDAVSTYDHQPTIGAYLNGGLLILPKSHFHQLRLLWPKWNRWLLDRPELLGSHTTYTDQVSFALSLEEMGRPVEPLGLDYNCPTHNPYDKPVSPEFKPKVLHYHDCLDPSGLLKPTHVPQIDSQIERINSLIRDDRRIAFDNFLFWQLRYHAHPALGSGLGSRGESLQIKRDLLRYQLERLQPASVLDVGCGDLEVTRQLIIERYTGIDISSNAIEQARSKRPYWSFQVGNILDLDLKPHTLTVCFDVVIHQPAAQIYEDFCRRLIELSGEYLIVAGYNQPPWHTSEITFYYEPLAITLARLAPEGSLAIIGGYRDTTVLLWSRFPDKPLPPPLGKADRRRSLARRALGRIKRKIFRSQ